MTCDDAREAISADLDGEAHPFEHAVVDRHLRGCPACRAFLTDATALHRATRVRPAEPVPDLTMAIVAAVGPIRPNPGPHWSRYVLGAIAVTELLLAIPAVFLAVGADSGTVHPVREMGAADLAVAVGLLVAALQPWRVYALLPFASVLGVAVAATSTLDLVRGDTDLGAEAHHILELVGIATLVVLHRRTERRPDRAASGVLVQ